MQTISKASLKKLQVILHRGFVEARNLALRQANQQIFDLADTFEIIPPMLEDWDDEKWVYVRAILQEYQDKYPGIAYDYVSMLNMSDQHFLDVFDAKVAF